MPPIPQIIRSRRKTIALIIQPNGELLIRAPKRATKRQINAMITQHADWIAKKQVEAKETQAAFTPRQFADGETFPFLGANYALECVDVRNPKFALNGNFQLTKSAQGQVEQLFKGWYRQQARAVFTERVAYYAKEYSFDYAKLKLSSARTRWGSCSSNGNINLTWRLVMAPLEIVDYVVVHELSHLREHNHSKAFWAQVEAILPDYKSRRKWLKEHGKELHFP